MANPALKLEPSLGNAMEPATLDEKKSAASAWFRDLRDQICGAFEQIEVDYLREEPAAHRALRAAGRPQAVGKEGANNPSFGKFTCTPWSREDGGSGEMSVMKGRVFEKVGVNISTVHGSFSEPFRKEIPGAAENPQFWASGISLVAHMASPLVPAAHFNTRMICVGDQPARLWFGGGGDLNPMVEVAQDTADFHAAFKAACDPTDAAFYPAFKNWCDEYFFIPHRNAARGVGGVFYDYLGLNRLGSETSNVALGQFGKGGVGKEATMRGMEIAANANLDWAVGFAFTQAIGRAFARIYPEIIRRHMFESWTDEQRHHQLVKRGRYAEYNLLYDRGTRFGLMTGGNAEAILMSLPPVAIWE